MISRGISCISFALVDGQSNPVSNHEWPRLITFFKMDDGVGPSSLNDFEELVTMNYYEKVPERGQFPWQQNLGARPHINLEVLKEKFESPSNTIFGTSF